MNIKEHTIIEEYTGTDGVRVVLAFYYPSTTVNVAAYDKDGNHIFGGSYTSRAGARIAVGRRFGRVHFSRMFDKPGW